MTKYHKSGSSDSCNKSFLCISNILFCCCFLYYVYILKKIICSLHLALGGTPGLRKVQNAIGSHISSQVLYLTPAFNIQIIKQIILTMQQYGCDLRPKVSELVNKDLVWLITDLLFLFLETPFIVQ